MDLFKQLVELNNKIELEKLALGYYTVDSDDEEEEIEFTKEIRNKFIRKYDKRNNRQFKIKNNTHIILYEESG
jgi:hypothetical protein